MIMKMTQSYFPVFFTLKVISSNQNPYESGRASICNFHPFPKDMSQDLGCRQTFPEEQGDFKGMGAKHFS